MKQVKNNGGKKWVKMLDDDLVNYFAEDSYHAHRQQFDDDCMYVGNFEIPNISLNNLEYSEDSFYSIDTGISRNNLPKASSNSILQVCEITDSSLVTFFKATLKVKNVFIRSIVQEPGRVVATHVDYNRGLFGKNRESLKDICAKDIYRYVCFLEDQQIGQMWALGRNSLEWKAGDIYQWPWYVPHATANASDYDRQLLIIVGY